MPAFQNNWMRMLFNNWPKLLFFSALFFGVMSLTVSLLYASKISDLATNKQSFDEIRDEYNQRVKALNGDRLVNEVATETIQGPAVVKKCNTILGHSYCNSVIRIAASEVQKPLNKIDPAIEKTLDDLKGRLVASSTEAQNSQSAVARFQPVYDFIQDMMKPFISVIILFASLWVVFSNKSKPDAQKWAFGSLGTVMGFWLK